MAEDTPTAIHDLVRRAFATLQAKDLETLMRLFAELPRFPSPRDSRGCPHKSVWPARDQWLADPHGSSRWRSTSWRFPFIARTCSYLCTLAGYMAAQASA